MYLFRWIVLLALLVSAGLFLVFALTGQDKYKKLGLTSIKITLSIAFLFFAIIMFERIK